jgi:hypothetical protein
MRKIFAKKLFHSKFSGLFAFLLVGVGVLVSTLPHAVFRKAIDHFKASAAPVADSGDDEHQLPMGSPQSLVGPLRCRTGSAHIGFKTRAFSRSNLARPNICFLIYLSRFTCPSV